ncbi:uncharacterized protein EAF02_003647 [Botrytis sinoallii]|uniref:uncharacterized protein n=1 Tax=Botrytis sinoallii TaxID=1463999 RepID=UPI0019001DF7|nr:uncharacterized protein EAF02_003647 [Botrytis sinoallii]KAF7887000.1 hypothetical protein EAF02_003647 [Botrytis sinoallii]
MKNEGNCSENKKKELCDTCNNIPAVTFFSNRKPTRGCELEYGPTKSYQLFEGRNALKELRLSATNGFSLCKLFQDALECAHYNPDEHLRRFPEYCDRGIWLQRRQEQKTTLQITLGSHCKMWLDDRLIIHEDEATTRSIDSPSYVTETESDSPANFALARSWLAECRMEHEDCRELLEFELPTRLLDVAVPSKPGIVRLCFTSDLPAEGADYAALSHCWGSNQPPKTTKNNLQSQLLGFPENRLPQTFYDAVRTTRELGLRYLWIDSLCIVQDDRNDFEVECARMNTIYTNALCTIAASDARDSRDGLFQSRTMKPVRLTYESDGSEPKLTVTIQPAFDGDWMGLLQSRGWVLQEQHLSPRIICYTKKFLAWECRTAIASEILKKMRLKTDVYRFANEEASPLRFLDGGRSKLGPSEESRMWGPDYKFKELRSHWYGAVHQYSHCRLSHLEDKLPAFAGFAAEWKRIKPNDEYLAGLWKSDIFRGLAWFPGSGKHEFSRRLPESDAIWPPSTPFRGIPSWSWAAFDGGVAHIGETWLSGAFYDYDYKPNTFQTKLNASIISSAPHLDSATTTTVGRNPFGHVSQGKITVSGWSIVVTLSESEFVPDDPVIGEGPKGYHLSPDHSVECGMVCFDYDPFCLPKIQVRLLQLDAGQALRGPMACVCGLALIQLKGEELTTTEDLYKRIGMFEIDCESFWLLRRERKVITMI